MNRQIFSGIRVFITAQPGKFVIKALTEAGKSAIQYQTIHIQPITLLLRLHRLQRCIGLGRHNGRAAPKQREATRKRERFHQ